MNRKLLLLLTVIIATKLQAQHLDIQAGVRADLTYSRINGDGMSIGYKGGFNAGVFAEIKIKGRWSVQPELLFSQRNLMIGNFKEFFAASASEDPGQYAFLSYMTLPVSLKYKLLDQLTLSAGVQYSYLVYADEALLRDKAASFKKNDFAVLAGFEYTPTKDLRFYGRFYQGVMDINNINTLHPWNMIQFQAGAGYVLFANGRKK
jgi:hypothetical protein